MPSARLYELLAEQEATREPKWAEDWGAVNKLGATLLGTVQGYKDAKLKNTRLGDLLGTAAPAGYENLRYGDLNDSMMGLLRLQVENAPKPIYGRVKNPDNGNIEIKQIASVPKNAAFSDVTLDIPAPPKPPKPSEPKPPSAPRGYRFKPDNTLELIPGGPEDRKVTLQDEKARGLQQSLLKQADSVMNRVDRAIEKVGISTAGPGSLLKRAPGTTAKDLDSDLRMIKANMSFATLQEMRRNSPTGGALGNTSDRELSALESTIANLDQEQSPAQLRKNLEDIRMHYANWKATVDQAKSPSPVSRQFDAQSESLTVNTGTQPPPGRAPSGNVDAVALEWALAHPEDPRSAPIRAKAQYKMRGK